MGAFQSGNRHDFRAVLESFTGTTVPMPDTGRWAKSGMVRGGLSDVAWRVMDAQYWGVPQRRKRIFLVADFRGQRAREILFKPGGLFQDSSTISTGELQTTAGNRISSVETGRPLPVIFSIQPRRMRSGAKHQNKVNFIGSFGKANAPFSTLLASDKGFFAMWIDGDEKNGVIRYLTPLECERLMGLPEGWTEYGYDGELISVSARCKALGNAIAYPCANYLMRNIKAALDYAM